MVVGVEFHYFGMRLENGRFSDLTYCKKPRSKFAWLEKTFDYRRRELCFEVEDFVYPKLSPIRGLRHFKVRGKLALRFIGKFKILEKRGDVAYQLELLLQLSDVHNVFYASQLKKCLYVPIDQIPIEDLDAKEDLSYQEYPVKILETSEKVTRNKMIKKSNGATHRGSYMGKRRRIEGKVFKFLFRSVRISGTRFILRGVGL
jgi:hypothetical protein